MREAWLRESVDTLGGAYDPALYAYSATACPVPGPLDALGAELADRLRSDGYLAVAAALDPSQVRAAVDGIDRLVSGAVPEFRGIQWEAGTRGRLDELSLDERRSRVRKLMYFVEYEPRLRALAYQPELLALAAELLGDEPELLQDQALLKPPGIGREKPWHQDKAFFDLKPDAPAFGVWIALDRTGPENGCMHVVPGSHRAGPVVHFNRRDFQICDTDVRRTEIVAVPLEPGGCLIFDGLLHHGTPANSSGRRRWALQFHYARKRDIWQTREQREAYKQRRLEVFGADGKDVTC